MAINLAKQGAGTNFIAANALNIGANGSSSGVTPLAVALLHLGQANVIWANTVQLGAYRWATNTLDFQAGLSNPTLTLVGTGGTNRISNMTIGQCQTASPNTATLDASLGTITCLVSNVLLANFNSGSPAIGTVIMSGAASVFDVLNLTLLQKDGTATSTTGQATFNQNGGLVKAQTINFGSVFNTNINTATIKAGYNLAGGTLRVQTMQPGTDGIATNLTGSYRTLFWTNGTLQNYDTNTSLTINAGSSVPPVAISASGSGNRFFAVDTNQTITVACAVNQGGGSNTPVVMTGPGTLDLQGTTDNPYLALVVSNGLVLLDKTSSTTPNVHAIGSGLTLNSGTVKLSGSGGDQIYDGNLVTLNSGTFDLNGQSETIGGLAGTGGILADSVGGATLTVNVATGTNYTSAATINNGNLAIGLVTAGGLGTQIFTGTDNRVSESTTINSGTLQIGNGGAAGNLAGASIAVNSPGFLAFKQSGTLNFAGSISGNGSLAQNGSGTLTLSGSDTHSGSTLVNAGTLAMPSGASVVGGTVVTVASGATLNVTAGSGFTINTGQTLNGAGTVTGSYAVASGATNAGSLTVNGNVTLQDGSLLNPGAALAAGTITVTGNFTGSGNNTLLYHLAGTTTPGGGTNSLLAVTGNLDLGSSGTTTLNLTGTPSGGYYVIATFGTWSGNIANVTASLGGSTRYTFTPQIVGNQLRLVVNGNAANLVWIGDGSGNAWDANNAGNPDWLNTGTSLSDFFNNGDNALFNDVSPNQTVNINSTVQPTSVTINSTSNYIFAGSADITGPIALTKTNSGTLTIQNNNTFTGAVNLNGGVVSVATVDISGNPQPLGEGSALNFNGGTFQYTGAAVGVGGFNRDLTLGAHGGTVEQESSSGIYLFITNKITGAGSFTKTGSQQLILGDFAAGTGSNDYTGITYVYTGDLQIRNASALGSTAGKTVIYAGGDLSAACGGTFTNSVMENIDLAGGYLRGGPADFGGVITVVSNATAGGTASFSISGPIGGAASLEKVGSGTLTLLNNGNTYAGGTVISGGVIQLGTNGSSGWLPAQPGGMPLTNNASLVFNRADTNALNDVVTGTGGLTQNGSGTTILGVANTFTGNVVINGTSTGGALLATNSLALGGGNVTINGGTALGVLQLAGNIDINNSITLGQKNNVNNGAGAQAPHISNVGGTNSVTGAINANAGGNYWAFNADTGRLDIASFNMNIPTSAFGRPLYLEGAGNGVITNLTDSSYKQFSLQKYGAGTWTIAGAASLPSGLQVYQGTLVVDGAVDNGTNTGNATVTGGRLIVNGTLPGTVTVATGAYFGGTGIITNAVTIQSGGTLAPSLFISTNTALLTLNSNLTLTGNLWVNLNKSLVQSNDFVFVGGKLTNTAAGTLTVSNYGPALVAGDKFTLFSQPVGNGGAITSILPAPGAGLAWSNSLATDGSLIVVSAAVIDTNANLTALVLTPAGTLSPTFNSNTVSYAANEAYANGATFTVTPTSASVGAVIKVIYGGATNPVVSGSASGSLTLNAIPGVTNVVVRVTAADNVTIKNYTVTVTRQPSLTPPLLTSSLTGGSLNFSWPADHTGWKLQVQTNTLSAGLSGTWYDWPNSANLTSVTVPIVSTNPTVFFRMTY